MTREQLAEFKAYKREAMNAARDLLYGPEVLKQLQNADTIGEIETIMVTARKEKFK